MLPPWPDRRQQCCSSIPASWANMGLTGQRSARAVAVSYVVTLIVRFIYLVAGINCNCERAIRSEAAARHLEQKVDGIRLREWPGVSRANGLSRKLTVVFEGGALSFP